MLKLYLAAILFIAIFSNMCYPQRSNDSTIRNTSDLNLSSLYSYGNTTSNSSEFRKDIVSQHFESESWFVYGKIIFGIGSIIIIPILLFCCYCLFGCRVRRRYNVNEMEQSSNNNAKNNDDSSSRRNENDIQFLQEAGGSEIAVRYNPQ